MNHIEARLNRIAAAISAKIGQPVQITVRWDQKFTISTEQVCPTLEKSVKDYFGAAIVLDAPTEHDDECGSFVYFRIA